MELSRTYDGGGLRSLDWETVGFDWGTGACCLSFLVLALDLWRWEELIVAALDREGCKGWASTFAFFETGIFES